MAEVPHRGRWFWERFDPTSGNAGADLAALRRGVGRAPGSVPEMWPYYRAIVDDAVAASGGVPRSLEAEHAALTLFSVHQQSQSACMHHADVGVGAALLRLRRSEKFSVDALDRRVHAAATATDAGELVAHLRGLVTQLRAISQPLDYSSLARDVYDWRFPDSRARVRRRWGLQYYGWTERPTEQSVNT